MINLWGGPSSGKSTTAAGLFHLLKVNDHKAELVTEYAKELVYEKRDMTDQLMMLAQQNRRLRRLEGVVDWVITDSPIPLGLIYAKPPFDSDWFQHAVRAVFGHYDNINIILKRTKKYQQYGRLQSENEAIALDKDIKRLARGLSSKSYEYDGDANAPSKIYRFLIDNYSHISADSNR